MYTHNYKCKSFQPCTPQNWTGEILYADFHRIFMEGEVQARGNSFHIVIGTSSRGNYLCIPNWSIGIALADFNDYFWNHEKLRRDYPELSEVDACSITYAIAEMALIAGL